MMNALPQFTVGNHVLLHADSVDWEGTPPPDEVGVVVHVFIHFGRYMYIIEVAGTPDDENDKLYEIEEDQLYLLSNGQAS